MLEDFFDELADRYAPSTLTLTRRWLRYLEVFAGDKELTQLTPDDLTQWRQSLIWRPGPSGRNYSESSINQAIGAIRLFYNWAVEQGYISKNPVTHLKTRRPPRKQKPRCTSAKRRHILENIDPTSQLGSRNRALIGLLLETGISCASCARIDLAHLQLDTGALLTRDRWGSRVHSLSSGLLLDLRNYLDFCRPGLAQPQEQALFVSQKGVRLAAAGIRIIHKRLLCGDD